MLTEGYAKIKRWIKDREDDLITALIIVAVAIGSFGLGRLSAIYDARTPIIVKNAAEPASLGVVVSKGDFHGDSATPSNTPGLFVASKNGAKYYPTDCPAAKKISPTNLVYFASATEAEKGGYESSASCN
jgi:hypothetical protein